MFSKITLRDVLRTWRRSNAKNAIVLVYKYLVLASETMGGDRRKLITRSVPTAAVTVANNALTGNQALGGAGAAGSIGEGAVSRWSSSHRGYARPHTDANLFDTSITQDENNS